MPGPAAGIVRVPLLDGPRLPETARNWVSWNCPDFYAPCGSSLRRRTDVRKAPQSVRGGCGSGCRVRGACSRAPNKRCSTRSDTAERQLRYVNFCAHLEVGDSRRGRVRSQRPLAGVSAQHRVGPGDGTDDRVRATRHGVDRPAWCDSGYGSESASGRGSRTPRAAMRVGLGDFDVALSSSAARGSEACGHTGPGVGYLRRCGSPASASVCDLVTRSLNPDLTTARASS